MVKLQTSHKLQMPQNNSFCSFALGSTHMKFGIWAMGSVETPLYGHLITKDSGFYMALTEINLFNTFFDSGISLV